MDQLDILSYKQSRRQRFEYPASATETSPFKMNDGTSPHVLRKRHEQLDGLRAVAITGVAWSHWMPASWQLGLPWGHFGVQLFFVLSGYLITRSLHSERAADSSSDWPALKTFAIHRVLRIAPPYFILLTLLLCFDVSDARRNAAWYVLFVSNVRIYLTNDFNTLLAHFWTLCVEMHFYILWPLLVLYLSRMNLTRLSCTLLLIAPAMRVASAALNPDNVMTVTLPGTIDAFAAGALVALLPEDCAGRRRYTALQMEICLPVFLVLQFVAAVNGLGHAVEAVRQTAMVIVFAAVVRRAVDGYRGAAGAILSAPAAIRIGTVSYGMYLVHNFVPHLLHGSVAAVSPSHANVNQAVCFTVFFAITFAIASASWTLIERPLMAHYRHAAKRQA